MRRETNTAKQAVLEGEVRGTVDHSVAMIGDPAGAVAEHYRVLAQRIGPSIAKGARRIGVASALPGDGRTTAAVNLALALAASGRYRVALVDADLRRPNVAKRMGLTAEIGLADIAEERASLDSALWRFGGGELHVLPGGTTMTPHRAIASTALAATLHTLGTRFDVVIVDLPAVLPTADALLVAPELDGVIWAIRAGRTPLPALRRAMERLDGPRHLGAVLIGVEARAVPWAAVKPFVPEQPTGLLLPAAAESA